VEFCTRISAYVGAKCKGYDEIGRNNGVEARQLKIAQTLTSRLFVVNVVIQSMDVVCALYAGRQRLICTGLKPQLLKHFHEN